MPFLNPVVGDVLQKCVHDVTNVPCHFTRPFKINTVAIDILPRANVTKQSQYHIRHRRQWLPAVQPAVGHDGRSGDGFDAVPYFPRYGIRRIIWVQHGTERAHTL